MASRSSRALATWALASPGPADSPLSPPSLFLALGTIAPSHTGRSLLLLLTYAGAYVLVVNLIRTRPQLDRLVAAGPTGVRSGVELRGVSYGELEAAVDSQPAQPARPERWGGYRLIPDTYEFWRHRDDRLHERHLFRARGDGWDVVMLQP